MQPDFRQRLNGWLQANEKWLQALVLIAALATVPVLLSTPTEQSRPWLIAADWAIWVVFALELLLTTLAAPRPVSHLRKNLLSVVVVILSYPHLPDLLAATRLMRLARLSRLARVTMIAGRGVGAARRSLGNQSLIYTGVVVLLMTVAAGAAMSFLEPNAAATLGDGLWWAAVTVTTVGYGDVTPQTPLGRTLAVVLMLCGLGLVSTLAAAISARFVDANAQAEQSEILRRLDRIEDALAKISARQSKD